MRFASASGGTGLRGVLLGATRNGCFLDCCALPHHVAPVKGDGEQQGNNKKNAKELLIAQQNLGFALACPQHF